MSSTDPVPASRRDPVLLAVLGVLAVLILVALVVVFARGRPVPLADGTPGGVVQRYTTAVLDGDEERATGYLSDDALAGCDGGSAPFTDDIRVTLLGTTERDTSADVRVSIVTSYDNGPFGPTENRTDEVFDLVKADGAWLIDRAPWQLTVCPAPGQGTP